MDKKEVNQQHNSIVSLGEVCIVQKGTTITKASVKNGDIPVIAGGKAPAYYHNESNRKGDTITVSASGANAGFVNFFAEPIFASDCSTIDVIDDKKTNILYVYINLRHQQQNIYAFQRGGAQPHVYPADIRNIQIPIPPIKEQEKIVGIISTWDSAIDNVKKQIEAHKKQRIGITQKLLGDDLKGSLVNWDTSIFELTNLCSLETGSRNKGGALKSGIPSIGGEQVNKDGSINFKKMKYVSLEHFNSMKQGKTKKGDVLMVKDGATTGKVGYLGNIEKDMAVNEHVFIMRHKDNILPYYLYIMARSDYFQKEIKKRYKGIIGGVGKEIGKIKVHLPSMEDQKNIVYTISTLDKKIQLLEQLLEKYELQRKGLIQKLLGDITKNVKH